MNIFSDVRKYIIEILEELSESEKIPQNINVSNISVEPPKDISHGDIATNAAMVICKQAKMKPRDLAELIKTKLEEKDSLVYAIEIAGPGFINMRFKDNLLFDLVCHINKEKLEYGKSSIGNNEKTNIEFVSANPTGPMHIGHARGAAFGDTLVRLMRKAGYDVVSEYYINDAGSQIDVLTRSVYLRYKEALGNDIGEIPEGLYPGDYLVPVGKELAEKYGDKFLDKDESEWFDLIRDYSINAMLEVIRKDLKDMGVEHDVFTSEYKLHKAGKIEEGLDLLDSKGLIYQGVLEPPKGKKPEDWESREQTLFKSSDYGDDVDRPIKKSDGSWTYFAADIAYHVDKYKRGFNNMILGLGADHGGYLKRMNAAVSAISDNEAKLSIKFHQLVNLYENGQQLKMSKRAGTFVTVREVLDSVGKDVMRFIMLTRKNDAVLDFDLAKVKEQSKDNPIFYVQYAYARISSVLRHMQEDLPEIFNLIDNNQYKYISKISSDDEKLVIKKLAEWPRIVELSAQHLEPHRVAYYLQELAGEFHSLWNKGKDNTELRFIDKENLEITASKAVLLISIQNVIASALAMFNIDPMEQM